MYHHMLELRYAEEREHLFFTVASWHFALGLIQIFVPIVLWRLGFSLPQIFLFFFIQFLTRALVILPSVMHSGQIGAKHVLSISFIFPVLFYLFFSQIQGISSYFFLAAISMGLLHGYGWPAYHLHTSKITPENKRGKTLSLITALQLLTFAAAPAIGGYVIENTGVSSLLIWVIVLFTLGAIALINTKEVFKGHRLNTRLLTLRRVARDSVANGFFNIKFYMSAILWPLFMVAFLPTLNNIGYLEGISIAISIMAVLFLGRWLDHNKRKKVLVWTSALYAPIAIVRLLAFNPISLVIFHVIYRLVERANGLVWVSIFHSNLSKHPRAEYLLWFELVGALMVATASFAFIFVAQAIDFKTTLMVGMIFGGLSSLMANLVSYRETEWSQIEAK